MALIHPSEEIARRWSGALQTRLRQAPLERFLRERGVAPALTGPSQVTDNLVRTTVLIVDDAVLQGGHCPEPTFYARAVTAVGHIACVVSRVLAAQISEPGAWRVAALVSTAQLLRAHIGLSAAAIAAASSVRRYEQELTRPLPALDARIRESVSHVLNHCSAPANAEASALIAMSLSLLDAKEPAHQVSAEACAHP